MTTAAREQMLLPLDQIEQLEDAPNYREDETSIKDLVESIREHGLLQPLLVARLKGKFYLAAGYRRLAALRKIGHVAAPCLILEAADHVDVLVANTVENLQRENPPAAQLAKRVLDLRTTHGLSTEQVARKLSVSPRWVCDKVALAKNAVLLDAVAEGAVTEKTARLIRLRPKEKQEEILQKIVEETKHLAPGRKREHIAAQQAKGRKHRPRARTSLPPRPTIRDVKLLIERLIEQDRKTLYPYLQLDIGEPAGPEDVVSTWLHGFACGAMYSVGDYCSICHKAKVEITGLLPQEHIESGEGCTPYEK